MFEFFIVIVKYTDGDIASESRIYDNNFSDHPSNSNFSHIENLNIVIDRDYTAAVSNADEFALAVDMEEINYDILGPNSNSYAFSFLESITGFRHLFPDDRTLLGAQAHWIRLDVDLSYSPAPIIAGGAFTVGNIFQ